MKKNYEVFFFKKNNDYPVNFYVIFPFISCIKIPYFIKKNNIPFPRTEANKVFKQVATGLNLAMTDIEHSYQKMTDKFDLVKKDTGGSMRINFLFIIEKVLLIRSMLVGFSFAT